MALQGGNFLDFFAEHERRRVARAGHGGAPDAGGSAGGLAPHAVGQPPGPGGSALRAPAAEQASGGQSRVPGLPQARGPEPWLDLPPPSPRCSRLRGAGAAADRLGRGGPGPALAGPAAEGTAEAAGRPGAQPAGELLRGARGPAGALRAAPRLPPPARQPALLQGPRPALPRRLQELPLLPAAHDRGQDGVQPLRGREQLLRRPRARLLVRLLPLATRR